MRLKYCFFTSISIFNVFVLSVRPLKPDDISDLQSQLNNILALRAILPAIAEHRNSILPNENLNLKIFRESLDDTTTNKHTNGEISDRKSNHERENTIKNVASETDSKIQLTGITHNNKNTEITTDNQDSEITRETSVSKITNDIKKSEIANNNNFASEVISDTKDTNIPNEKLASKITNEIRDTNLPTSKITNEFKNTEVISETLAYKNTSQIKDTEISREKLASKITNQTKDTEITNKKIEVEENIEGTTKEYNTTVFFFKLLPRRRRQVTRDLDFMNVNIPIFGILRSANEKANIRSLIDDMEGLFNLKDELSQDVPKENRRQIYLEIDNDAYYVLNTKV